MREPAFAKATAGKQKKSLTDFSMRLFKIKDRQRLTLPGVIQVPSALAGLTALFGMGRGDPRRYSHLKILGVGGEVIPAVPIANGITLRLALFVPIAIGTVGLNVHS